MKTTRRILCILLAFVLVTALSVTALAKTSSEPIADPADTAVVFEVRIGSKTVSFTWADINGKGAFASVTNTYAAKIDGEQATQEWTGVPLSDLLDAVEDELAVTIEDNYKISAIAADGYMSVFTAGDVRDAENAYIVAPEAVKNFDGDTAYPDSYVRICLAAETSNKANIRCVTGIKILDAAGREISLDGKTAGGDVENAVFYIAVKESADSDFKYYYYTRADLEAYGDTHDFSYVDHSVPKTVTGRGASLKSLLADITDAEITGDMIVQYAESDGYHADVKTPIEDSAYKDKVAWLGEEHITSGGETAAAVETMVCLDTWTVYETPDENNVNSTEWEDADLNSGYLRAYRQRGDANSAVIKTLMGAVVSYDGVQFSGRDGYTLRAESLDGNAMRIIEPSTGIAYKSQSVTGLVPGMQWTVKAPDITGAVVSGESKKTVTAAGGTEAVVTFTYRESDYLTVDGKVYTLSALDALDKAAQTPSAEEVSAHGTPYGYYDAMYYRYNGVWLNDLVSGDATVSGADGSTLSIPSADLAKYFVATGYTASKSSTNVSEGKRYTYAYAAPKLLIPGEGTLVGENEVGAEGNKMVPVAVDAAVSVTSAGASECPFTDLGSYDWAKDSIIKLYNLGVVKGMTDTTFEPGANIRRGDFMLMLYRAYGLNADAKDNFADVPASSYYYDAIAAAKAAGIAQGDGVNFYPQRSITRQEAMTLIYRTLTYLGKDLSKYSGDLSAFSDASQLADWASDGVSALVGAGIITGASGKLNPTDYITRAEMSAALCRAIEKF